MSDATASAPPILDAKDAADLRADLAGWTVESVEGLVGDRAFRALDREQILPALVAARDAGDDTRAVLTRLLMLGDSVERDRVRTALARLGVEGAERIGLVEADGERAGDFVRARVDLRPYSTETSAGEIHWWIASDQGESVTSSAVGEHHVLGVGGASTMLASVTMRTPRRRVLDLGTGCGIQALHASLHADAVVATDISERALAFAAFNEALNGATLGGADRAPWDLRLGSMLEPVFGEAFDLVVSNPPFVITPSGAPTFEYRDGGMAGDGIVETLMRTVGSVLAPGGVAQFLGNWEIHGEWSARLSAWLDASEIPLDAWVVQRDVLDAAEYAETWLRDAGVTPERDADGFAAAYESYLREFDARGVDGIGFGLVVLRRPLGGSEAVAPRPTLRRFEELEGPLAGPLGSHLAAALEAHDWQATLADDDLLAMPLTVAPDVTKEVHGRPLLVDPEHILLRQGGGFGRSVKADTALAGFVGACDGELTVGQIAHALAALLDVESEVMIRGLVPAVRELVVDGFLLPPS